MPLEPSDVESELPFDAKAFGWSEEKFKSELETYIAAATETVEKWINTTLEPETVTRDLSRPSHVDGHDLPMPSRPVQDVVSVTIDTDRAMGRDVDEDDYWVEETHLELKPGADRKSWPTDRRCITVEWEYGYEEVPESPKKAIIRLVRARLRAINAEGISSDTIMGDSISYDPEDEVVLAARKDVAGFEAPSYYGGVE
ncbi:hypothetical protein PhiCh1p14 [Natrialba phage PhiCh1]|uniref:Uncharacterized protein n=1 Tax=Natrialba phage PhiCh1 TaxID=114777 RepID=Q8JL43_9CAUD|nr:hypothetical protein PhiCh1p14 [Natrialba phage PhiCh1]AAM88687.1 unknown [Natrialba phage PhiCh1]